MPGGMGTSCNVDLVARVPQKGSRIQRADCRTVLQSVRSVNS